MLGGVFDWDFLPGLFEIGLGFENIRVMFLIVISKKVDIGNKAVPPLCTGENNFRSISAGGGGTPSYFVRPKLHMVQK